MAVALAVVAAGTTASSMSAAAAAVGRSPGRIDTRILSAGARAWFDPPSGAQGASAQSNRSRIAFGTNVDANDPSRDVAAGQSETAIAASGSTVVAAWNDISGALVQPSTSPSASGTGLGVSVDGGRHFHDLIGLRNSQPNQQWFGDPSVVRLDSSHFAVGSLYLPSAAPDCTGGRTARLQIAVEIVRVRADGSAALGLPVVAADGGDACPLFSDKGGTPDPDLAFLDKDWLGYDSTTRTLAVSYTREFFGGPHHGTGQIEMVRAHVPTDPGGLSSRAWSSAITVWPEESNTLDVGAYVSVARNGDAYVAWERNAGSNLFDGDPYVYIHVARVAATATTPVVGGPTRPRVVTLGQHNASRAGGVKSLDAVAIAGYNRGQGQDFPRIAVDAPLGKVVVVWNDASAHPLGDIWMRALPMDLTVSGSIAKVNDDSSSALHFLPAVSVRANGSIATSWYDRRLAGPNSTRTDYFAETRTAPTTQAKDVRITTGATDWSATSSLINPNFGDYTDNASSGSTTYYAWADGRIGVPQPFVDRRR
ncbi:hypothetical protein QDR37_01540 [Amnibacterium sp. CER49]|uniref:hypothetical protein n=1 Tax=Amnibacterium sp. CER49 TaxID=3039161 RepID=UPI002447FCD4|nr:hypothetical protein [Amnibacterium sp. CER49]MDH2442618.1 hypothetical protein [Amnibacterium sp. CER49]